MEFHELSTLYPKMNEATKIQIYEDMVERGYDNRYPILTFEGKIVDGRNRYDAAMKADVTPMFEEFKGNKEDLLNRIIADNNHLAQRQLSTGQRAMVGARALDEHLEYHGYVNGHTLESMADAMGVSLTSLRNAVRLREKRPTAAKRVANGSRKLNSEINLMRDEDKKDEKVRPAGHVVVLTNPSFKASIYFIAFIKEGGVNTYMDKLNKCAGVPEPFVSITSFSHISAKKFMASLHGNIPEKSHMRPGFYKLTTEKLAALWDETVAGFDDNKGVPTFALEV